MRKAVTALLVVALMSMTLSATATEGNHCIDDGVHGVTVADGSCLTEAEYAATFSVEALLEAGVITSYVDNGDGTATVQYAVGGSGVIAFDPLDRVVSSSGDGPTVREVLYPECIAASIDEDGTLTDTFQHRDDGALRIGTIGSYFIVSYNNTGPRGMILGDVLSIEIADDAIAVEACMDGNVTFTFASVDESTGETHTHEEATDLIQFWIDWGYVMRNLLE